MPRTAEIRATREAAHVTRTLEFRIIAVLLTRPAAARSYRRGDPMARLSRVYACVRVSLRGRATHNDTARFSNWISGRFPFRAAARPGQLAVKARTPYRGWRYVSARSRPRTGGYITREFRVKGPGPIKAKKVSGNRTPCSRRSGFNGSNLQRARSHFPTSRKASVSIFSPFCKPECRVRDTRAGIEATRFCRNLRRARIVSDERYH